MCGVSGAGDTIPFPWLDVSETGARLLALMIQRQLLLINKELRPYFLSIAYFGCDTSHIDKKCDSARKDAYFLS